jgi:hypothetical protein
MRELKISILGTGDMGGGHCYGHQPKDAPLAAGARLAAGQRVGAQVN